MITVRAIAKSFGSRMLWSDVSFSVRRGELLALVGPSGCGKSTLLNCLGLMERVDRGEIIIDGRDVTRLRPGGQRRFRRDMLGYLFQNYALIDNATVAVNLEVATGAGRGSARARDGFEAALDQVGLAGRGREMVYRLSGGEQQRVALARLMVKNPSVVLADEPTGALDSENATVVMDVLRKMAGDGCAVVIATHSERVRERCDASLPLGEVPATRQAPVAVC